MFGIKTIKTILIQVNTTVTKTTKGSNWLRKTVVTSIGGKFGGSKPSQPGTNPARAPPSP